MLHKEADTETETIAQISAQNMSDKCQLLLVFATNTRYNIHKRVDKHLQQRNSSTSRVIEMKRDEFNIMTSV